MKIISQARKDLGLLLDSAPGERFRDRYQRRQTRHRKQGERSGPIYRVMYLCLGLVVFVFGIVMFPLPGPGWATCLLGLGLVAGEYAIAARLLDGLEVLSRKMVSRLRRRRS